MASKAKKSYINRDNPALNFISSASVEPEKEEVAAEPAKAPEGYKVNPMYVEVKSKRLQLVLQPSLFARVKAAAAENGVSVNEFCHQVLDRATREG